MSTRPSLKAIVADLSNAGYRTSDIARVLNCSHERIRQTLIEMGMACPKLEKVDDLPHDLRVRVLAFMELDNPTVAR